MAFISPLTPKKPKRFLSKENARFFYGKLKSGIEGFKEEQKAKTDAYNKMTIGQQAREDLIRKPARILGGIAGGIAGGVSYLAKSALREAPDAATKLPGFPGIVARKAIQNPEQAGERLQRGYENFIPEEKVFGYKPRTVQEFQEAARRTVEERGGTRFEQKVIPAALAIGSIAFESPGNPFKGGAKKIAKDIGKEVVEGAERQAAKSFSPAIDIGIKNLKEAPIPFEEYARRFDDAVAQGNPGAIEMKQYLDDNNATLKDLHDYALGNQAEKQAIQGTPEEILRQAEEKAGVTPASVVERQKTPLTPQERFAAKTADDIAVTGRQESKIPLIEEGAARQNAKFASEQEAIRAGNAAEEALKNAPKENNGVFASLKKGLKPFKYADAEAKTAYKNWEKKTFTGKRLADAEVEKLKDIPKGKGLEVIKEIENGGASAYAKKTREEFDKLFTEAKARGLDVQYTQNYIPHVYAQSAEEIQKRIYTYLKEKGLPEDDIVSYMKGEKELTKDQARALKINPSFSKERTFPTYEEAAKYGLTPKYENPAQLLAYYRDEMEKTIANKEFIDELAQKHKILVDSVAPREWVYLNAPSFQGYKAPKYLASIIDDLFQATNVSPFQDAFGKIVSGTANVSKRMQEIALSGGIPLTNVNFFSIGQTIKELTRGNVKALEAFARANSRDMSIKWLEKNKEYIQMMAKNGIDLGEHVASYQNVFDSVKKKINPLNSDTWRHFWGDKKTFDTLFNERTFSAFMPQLHTQVFRDVYKKALKKGVAGEEAEKMAAEITKKTFGLIDEWGRSKGTKDALSATFFAPRFRESILNTLMNTGRSVTTKMFDPSFKNNRKLALGMILTYAAYNALNKELNGQYMWENPENRKFALRIPNKNGGSMYIEYMPSFLAFARNLAQGGISLAKGDFKNAGQKVGSVFSMPIKTVSEVLSNQDYFGREIYSDSDPTAKKIGKIVAYTGLQAAHPFIKEMVKHFGVEGSSKLPFVKVNKKENRPALWQSLITAAELPVKFGSKEKEAKNQYYDELDQRTATRSKENKEYKKVLDEIRALRDAGDTAKAEEMYNALSDSEKEIIKRISTAEKTASTKKRKEELYVVLLDIRKAKDAGNTEEADALYNDLSPEDQELITKVAEEHPRGE